MDHPDVARFLDWAANDRGRSPATIRRYAAVLAQLDDPLNATRDDVEAWWQTRRNKSPATRENELACLRSFYKWATRWDHRPDDPTRRLEPPKVQNRIPKPIGRADLTKLLDAAEPDLRRAICLGAYGGLRISEAAGLEWSNVDQENRRLRIRGKGSKERLCGLSPVLLDEILPNVGGNVVRAGDKPYSADVLQRKVNRLMVRLEVPHTFHDLRKRYVTLGIAKTGNIHAVAQAAGWASIETASAYALVSDDALDRIAAAAV